MSNTQKSQGRVRAAAGLIACLGLFALLAVLAATEAGRRMDRWVLEALRPPEGGHRLIELLRDLTALGSLSVLGAATLICAGWMVVRGMARTAGLVVAVITGGVGLSFVLKLLYSQPRPGLADNVAMVFTSSYPSSHAMGSIVTFVALAWVGAQSAADRRSGAYLLWVALAVSLVSGVSRISLGVHWPSDVLAGWLIGVAWLLLAWLLLPHLAGAAFNERVSSNPITWKSRR